MALTADQQKDVASLWALENFVKANVTANFGTDSLIAAGVALDNAFDTTLNAAVTAVGGTKTIIQALAASIPAPFSGATIQQKTLLACYVLMKRAGII